VRVTDDGRIDPARPASHGFGLLGMTERAQLLSRLAEMDRVDVVASQANVVWLGVEGMDGAELAARLERAKVIVASGARFGDASRIRAQIQNEAASDRLVDALTKALM